MIDFGDGSPTESLGVIPPGGSIATVHRYQRADAYVVRVTSTDSSGIQGTSTTVVNVTRGNADLDHVGLSAHLRPPTVGHDHDGDDHDLQSAGDTCSIAGGTFWRRHAVVAGHAAERFRLNSESRTARRERIGYEPS